MSHDMLQCKLCGTWHPADDLWMPDYVCDDCHQPLSSPMTPFSEGNSAQAGEADAPIHSANDSDNKKTK